MAGIPLSTLQRMAADGDRQAASMLERFERRYIALARETRQAEHCMQHARNGAPILDRAPDAVNGAEHRASRRWQSTPEDVAVPDASCRSIVASSRRYRERGLAATLAAATGAGREWRPFTPPARETGAERRRARRVAAPISERAERNEAARERTRALMAGRIDRSLADGSA